MVVYFLWQVKKPALFQRIDNNKKLKTIKTKKEGMKFYGKQNNDDRFI